MFSFQDYRELNLPYFIGHQRPLYSQDKKPKTLRFKLLGHKVSRHIAGTVVFGKQCEGPPHHAHGGMIAFVLDEAMGSAAWYTGYPCVAEKIDVNFIKMVPLHQKLYVLSKVTRKVKNGVHVVAHIVDDEGNVYGHSVGKFYILNETQLKKLQLLAKKTK
jgi:acyl-coenzyme A thioesterase PaaI-like protein